MPAKKVYKLAVFGRGQTHGRPVILVHGVMSTHRYWTGVAELIDDKRRLLMPDLLGFGASPKPLRAAYSLDQFVDCLEYTFSKYHFKEPPVLAGHSMGALIALRWAARHPKRFSGVVLSSPMFFEKDLLHQQLATIPLEGKWLTSKAWAKVVAFAMSLSGLIPTRAALRFARNRPRYVMEDVTRQSFIVFRRILKNTYFREDVLKELKGLRLPVSVIVGDQDHMAKDAIPDLEALCGENNLCHLRILSGSHQTILEHPETIAQAILDV